MMKTIYFYTKILLKYLLLYDLHRIRSLAIYRRKKTLWNFFLTRSPQAFMFNWVTQRLYTDFLSVGSYLQIKMNNTKENYIIIV